MLNSRKSIALAALLLVALAPLAVAQTRVTQTSLDQTIANWPDKPKQTVTQFVTKYGLPHEATASMVMWHDNGPWKHTIIHRDEIAHNFPKAHTDFVEQFIDYRVPVDKFDDLAEYDGSVIAERTKGEISARCDKEEMNFLALNLANDVARGTKSVEEARQFYADTAMAFMKGESRPYTKGLQFSLPTTRTADLDAPFTPRAMTSSAQEDADQNEPRNRMRKD